MKLSILVVLCLSITSIYGYTVVGNKIKDPTGAQVTLRGVDRPSFEWNANGQYASGSDYALMRSWGANVVRIALNQDYWLTNSAYATTIDQQIAWVNSTGMGVILDLHWNNGGQQNMADSKSITFWSQVAARYKSNAWIMFELYNEPHDISWSQWLSGDSTYAGMQQLYNAVRAAGANNLCIIGGLNWAFDLSGVSNGYALAGTNIAYATHVYDFSGKQSGDWPVAFGNLASTYPVIMTEFGQYCATNNYVSDVLVYAESLGIHWTAWAWFVSDCSFPSLISDWNGTPTSVGAIVKSYLSGKGPTVAPTSAPASSGSSSSSSGQASSAMVVYTDSLANTWQDWSWSTSYSIADTTYVHTGSKSIKFELVSYQGVYFHTAAFSIGLYNQIVFYVNGGTSTKASGLVNVKLYGTSGTQVGNAVPLTAAATANQWTQIVIPISSFGLASSTQIVGCVFQATVSASAGFVWFDDISFVPSGSSATPTTAPTSSPSTPAPTAAATVAPTVKPTAAPTAAPTPTPSTVAPTVKPTSPPLTSAPTPTPSTAAPTVKPTAAPTSAPTMAPTAKPTTAPPTSPTTRPTNAPATPAPGSCGPSSVYLVQTLAGTWQTGTQTVTQYNVEIHNTCSGKNLVGLTVTASNWNTVNFWNLAGSASSTSLSLPQGITISSAAPLVAGYQSTTGQATFTITSATFS